MAVRFEFVFLVVVGALILYQVHVYRDQQTGRARLHRWLKDNYLDEFTEKLERVGIRTPEAFADMSIAKFLAKQYSWSKLPQFASIHNKLEDGVTKMKDELYLYNWLESKSLEKYFPQLMSQGIQSIKSFSEMEEDMLNKLTTWDPTMSDLPKLRREVENTRGIKDHVTTSNIKPPTGIFYVGYIIFSWIWYICTLIAKSTIYLVVTLLMLFAGRKSVRHVNQVCQQHKVSLVSYMIGNYLQPRNTRVTWDWKDPEVVGKTMTFYLKFYRHNRTPHPISQGSITIEIIHDGSLIASSLEFGANKWREKNKVKVTFTVRQAGEYSIAVLAAGQHVSGSPFNKTFLPGPVDPSKCTIIERSSILVVQKSVYSPLLVEARDMYGNIRNITRAEDLVKYKVHITEVVGGQETLDPELFVDSESRSSNSLHVKLEQDGCFACNISYNGVSISNGELTIISLNEKDWSSVEKNVSKHCYNVWYEAGLLPHVLTDPTTPPPSGSAVDGAKKARKVYCYISPRYVSVKEFYMKFIPHKLHAFRVSPRTKFTLHPPDPSYEHPTFTLSDGAQTPVSIICRERNKLVATFSRMVLLNIGGSESFKKKQEFFNQKLLSYQGTKSGEVRLKINRSNLLESSYVACKSMGNDWLRLFHITFEGEEGLDWGGVRREWFELLCTALFSHENGLFTRFKEDDPQAPVHPNSKRSSNLKLKYYEFAGRIVGKCMYESAVSSTRRQNVKAKFTRSFLAQLLGLRVSYKYFESDDKDLYRSKIQYIEENDPMDLELKFIEEEYSSSGQLQKVVELKPGGKQLPVTEENKMEYLNLMAKYRLVDSVQKEIDAFINGLNEIVPDNLLGIFDEYELELLMCGTGHISVPDMKRHHTVISGDRSRFTKILDWFWTIVSSLTQDELARLMQFITGSSQLPPGGFAELSPQLQITHVAMNQALPMAHTCFNQLCLPEYSSFEEMQRKLLIAITEGSEGFGMA